MQVRVSSLDPRVIVFEAEVGDPEAMLARLTDNNHGYCVRGLDQLFAVIDGRLRDQSWCTPDHLLAIEAHEISHLINDTDNEEIADKGAISILEEHKFFEAANLLKERILSGYHNKI
jgi:hypothetical protein